MAYIDDGTPRRPAKAMATATVPVTIETANVVTIVSDDDSKHGAQQKHTSEETINEIHSQITAIQSSEEVNQINSALTHCTQLRSQLRGTLLHIQRLNSKYAHTDYMAVIRNLDNYRCQSSSSVAVSSAAGSPYPKIRSRYHSNDEIGNTDMGMSSTPVKRTSKMYRRRNCGAGACGTGGQSQKDINNQTFTSTPKRTKFSQLAAAFEFGNIDDGTPKRTVREMANKTSAISVCKIKVQRDIEAIITHLQVIQKQQLKRRQQELEQSLYQSCSNLSSFGSPNLTSSPFSTPSARQRRQHLSCMEQSNNSSYGTPYGSYNRRCNRTIDSPNTPSNTKFYTPPTSSSKFNASSVQFNEGKRTLERVERCCITPLHRMHKRLIHLNASLVRTC